MNASGEDRWITVPLTDGKRIAYRIRVDDAVLMTPVIQETAIVASVMVLLSLIIFISLTIPSGSLAPLDGLRQAMLIQRRASRCGPDMFMMTKSAPS